MPGLVTRYFHHHNAEQFFEAFDEASPSKLFLFVAKVTSFDDDNDPPTPLESVANTDFDYWRSMIAAKKLLTNDVSYVTPRYDWANNTVYGEYDSTSTTLFDAPASSNSYYVYTDDRNVYKCLYNNKGGSSTVKPTGTSTNNLRTSDGYIWKYMYTVSSADSTKFATADYIPVQTLTANNGSAQWTVQQAVSNGSIEVIDIKTPGSGYQSTNGTFVAVSSNTSMRLANSASAIDNYYNGYSLFITSGLGSTQISEVADYVGLTRTITLATPVSITPNTSSTYLVSPTVTITGDGSGATAYSNVNVSNTINHITMITQGSNYSKATVIITANSSHGSGAVAKAMISPPGGHGSDAVKELGGHYVMMSIQTANTVSNTFPVANDFRTFGIIKDPLLKANGAVANSFAYDMTTRLTLSSVTGSGLFQEDEIITGSATNAQARVVTFANTNSSNTAGILKVVSTNAIFSTSDIITANTSSVTGLITSITYGDLDEYSGDLIYIENRTPVERVSDQTEDFKIIVEF